MKIADLLAQRGAKGHVLAHLPFSLVWVAGRQMLSLDLKLKCLRTTDLELPFSMSGPWQIRGLIWTLTGVYLRAWTIMDQFLPSVKREADRHARTTKERDNGITQTA